MKGELIVFTEKFTIFYNILTADVTQATEIARKTKNYPKISITSSFRINYKIENHPFNWFPRDLLARYSVS